MGYSGRSTSWIGSESYNAKDYTITFQYHYDLNAAMLQQWRGETEQAVRYLLENVVAQDMPDYQKVLLIHDWIINNTRYNTANLEEEGNHLAYGALVKGSCVCMGYAEAGLIMFQAAGLDTCYISGEATNSAGDTESHAWNAVNVDGEWYHVDMTWDDPTSADNQDILRHNYFMVTDSQLAQDHVWNRVGLPICNGKQWSGDRVLSVCAQDGGTYSMYDASRYTTLEQVRKLFAGQLTSGVEAYNALQADHDMVSNWIDDSQRDAGEDSTPQVPAALKHEKRSFPWIIVFLVLFVVIVAVCVIGTIYRATVLRRRYRRSNDPQRFKSAGYVNFD